MSNTNKIHLMVRKSVNGWFEHFKYTHKDDEKGIEEAQYVMQLCGDARRGGFWIEQMAEKAGVPNFMEDFSKVLATAEKEKKALFSLYIKK